MLDFSGDITFKTEKFKIEFLSLQAPTNNMITKGKKTKLCKVFKMSGKCHK